MIRKGGPWLTLALAGALAGTAHAQPKPKPPDAAAKKAASAHYKQAKAYFDAGAFDKAIGEFRAAYDIAPANPLLFNIARSYQLAGQKADAVVWYHKYLDADPDGPLADEARVDLAEVDKAIADEAAAAALEKERQAKEAARVEAEAKHQAAVAAGEAHVHQAKAFAAAGAYADAAKEYVAAFDTDADAEHLFDAGAAARTGKDPTGARELYRRYVAAVPTGAHADAARKVIAELTVELAKPAHVVDQPPIDRVVVPVAPARPAVDEPTVEVGLEALPGIKLRADRPAVLAYRFDLAFHPGKRVRLGLYAEYGSISASGSCGTDIPGPTPGSPFDFGARNRFTSCRYVMPGLLLDIHILPHRRIDPWIGLSPGFRIGFNSWTPYVAGMAQSPISQKFLGVVVGSHAGVDYHPTRAFDSWVVAAFVEVETTVIGDEDKKNNGDGANAHYVTLLGGLRSTVAF